jgi:hypothetical protein
MDDRVVGCGAVIPSAPPSIPRACGDCVTTTKLAGQPGAGPQQFTSKLFRSSDGKVRVDSGNTSVITDPVGQQTIILDHVKKEAGICPMDVEFPKPSPAGTPSGAPPAVPTSSPPPLNVQDLGKKFIDGHEVEGKRYTLPPLASMPVQTPSSRLPNTPQVPHPPHTISEVWTSTKLNLPVLTKTTGGFGEQTCHCKYTDSGEPAPSLFQIPADYKPLQMTAVPQPVSFH